MDISQVLKTVAPWLASAIAGPLGGVAVDIIGDALGVSDKTQDGIKAALSNTTPEQLLALKKADQDFAIRTQELGLKREELSFGYEKDQAVIAAGDRDSARKREMAVGDKTARNLAYSITGGFFSTLGCLFWGDVDAGSKDVLLIMLGTLGTAWISVIAYYFGSTSNSKLKTELLAKAEPVKN